MIMISMIIISRIIMTIIAAVTSKHEDDRYNDMVVMGICCR